MPASDEVPVDRSGDDASSYSEDGVHGNVSDAPPAEEPPADDADGGSGAFDTLAAYIVGLHSLVEVCAEWSEEERAGGHPKMEARVSLIGDLETTARLLREQCAVAQVAVLFSGPRGRVVDANGPLLANLRSKIAELGLFVDASRRILASAA
ncbi:unnamed protein product [Clonostachys rosea f. rosea IK726]|uniref:Uncharacterized protein n=1 Tax=Clonostachys rosea f. rosea IK726 TaxID=1349383 RepID=A0ACA9UF09_BIOOC|nr:unnamed protein product [Clonostachys rosea f. rosea IK726]